MEAAVFELLVPPTVPTGDPGPVPAVPATIDDLRATPAVDRSPAVAPGPDVAVGRSAADDVAGAAAGSPAGPAAFRFETLSRHPADGTPTGGRGSRARSAAEVLADAHAEAERLREEARAEGLAAGLAEGRRLAAAELEPAARALQEALDAVALQGDVLATTLEREAVELALVVAEKVVAGAITERPERVLDVVQGALRGLVERRRISILVHPDDAELVRERIDALVHQLGGVEHCEVLAERRVPRGGAQLRTPDGELDVRLDEKLRRAAEVLREGPA